METFVGTHPLPTDINVQASQRILQFLSGRSENDLVIMLISGGGSALLSLPMAPMTCADEGTLFNQLTSRAAPIQDLNIVRKHLSLVRGGALAAAAYPAEVVSLIVSDVPGDAIASIASGPTVLDASTQDDAHAVLERYGITPPTGTTFIETPKDEKYFTRVTNTLFLSSRDALAGMLSEAVQRGYATTVCDSEFAGEARDIGRAIVEKLHNSPSKTALLYAGESTVTLSGSTAKGGRNQEMALSALESVQADELVVPFASDGCDNTDHAGAISDEITLTHIRDSSLSISEYLDEHRSYDFFVQTGDALITGPTGSNVADLVVALKA
jgi:hydroxypyruvate reductase